MGSRVLDDTIRIGLLMLGGLALAIAVAWYVSLVYHEISGSGRVVIDRFTVVRDDGQRNDELGYALAQMLETRLQSLARELRDAQAGLMTDVSGSTLAQASATAPVGDVRLWSQAVVLQTGLLEPVDIELSVGGVDVGGIIPWFQRRLTSRRTIHFTLYARANEAQVFGSLGALRLPDNALRLRVEGVAGAPPSLDKILDELAHEILRRCLSRENTGKLALLDPPEFLTLSEVLVEAAHSNRKSLLGRPVQKEFAALLPRITALADKVPNWPELGYLAGRIADSGKNPETAVAYYRRVLPMFERTSQTRVATSINARIATLTLDLGAASTPPAEPLPASIDYSKGINLVRDSGPEGSVVGQAMATALEFQIEKETNQSRRISARYIYYAARRAGGLDLQSDSGAYLKDAIAALSKEGAVEESAWPYRPGEYPDEPPPAVETATRFRVIGARPLSTLDELKRALKQNGPVVVGISLFESSMTEATSRSGVIPLPTDTTALAGGHAIVIVGYDDASRRLRFVNSWGSQWGDRGFGYLPYEYVEKYMKEAWTFKVASN
jgi:hypothetical protein